jgi:cation diffusion facilitator CzcD-associated flavoprotein CzcO
VHATGYLNKPDWPKIPGWEDFKGIKLQSAAYEENISLNGKEVILIGAGSSAIQILPAIQPIVKRVKIFIRSPTWLLPDISTEAGKFSQQQLDDFIAHPERVQALRQDNERTMNSIFSRFVFFFYLPKLIFNKKMPFSNVSTRHSPPRPVQRTFEIGDGKGFSGR